MPTDRPIMTAKITKSEPCFVCLNQVLRGQQYEVHDSWDRIAHVECGAKLIKQNSSTARIYTFPDKKSRDV